MKPAKRITEEEVESELTAAMTKAGADPAMIYAWQKTGRIVTRKSWKNLTKAERKEWIDAVKEYPKKAQNAQ